MKLQGSAQLQTVLALYDQAIVRDRVMSSHIYDHMIRARNFKARNERIETGVLVEKSALRGKWGAINGKQSDNVQKETLAVSVTEQHRETGAVTNKREHSLLLHQKRGHRLTEKSKGFGLRGEIPSGIKGRKACKKNLRGTCTNPSCDYWHPPCVKITSLNRDANMATIVSLDTLRLMGSPVKKSRRNVDGKGSVALLKSESTSGLCVSRLTI